MKLNYKKRGFTLVIILFIIVIIGVVGCFGYIKFWSKHYSPTIPVTSFDSTEKWKTLSDKTFSFSIQYPPTMHIKSKKYGQPGSKHEYFYIKNKEVLRLHINPNESPERSEFFEKTVIIGDNKFDVTLYPAGLDSGEIMLTAPILYYAIYHQNNKYSFEFHDRENLDELQSQILSTFKFTP